MQRTSRAHRLASFFMLIALAVGMFPHVPVYAAASPPSTRVGEAPSPLRPDPLIEPFVDPVRAALERAMGPDAEPFAPTSAEPSRLERLGLPAVPAAAVARPAPQNPLASLNTSGAAPATLQSLAAQPEADQPFTGNVQDSSAWAQTNVATEGAPPPSIAPRAPAITAPAAAQTAATEAAGPPPQLPAREASRPLPQTQAAITTLYLPLVRMGGTPVDRMVIEPTIASVLRSSDGQLELQVPAGAVTGTTTITYRTLPAQQVAGHQAAGVFFELTAQDAQGNVVRQFQRDLTLVVRYVDQPELDESRLALYFSDAATPAWTLIPSTVDTATSTVVATSNHFTRFAVLVQPAQGPPPTLTPCEEAGAGNGAPNETIRNAFVEACKDYNLTAQGGKAEGTVEAFGGAYAQQFTAGSLLYISVAGTFYYLPPEYVAAYKLVGGPNGPFGPPQTGNRNPTQAPAIFVDEHGNNFVGQDVFFLDKGFISKNSKGGGTAAAYPYFPSMPGIGRIQAIGKLKTYPPPVQGDPPIQKITLQFGTGVDPAPRTSTSIDVDLTLTVEAKGQKSWSETKRVGSVLQPFNYPYELDPGTPVIFWFKAARVIPATDDFVGYAPCTAFIRKASYSLNAVEDTFTFENKCEGADGTLPPPDTTPPTIHYVDIFQDGMGGVAVRALVTDNRAVASVSLTFNGANYPMQALGGDLYEVAIPNGPSTGTNTYRVGAVDTSGNSAIFPTNAPISLPASQARNFGSSIFKNGCPCGYVATVGDPVNTQNGNFTYAVTDIAVAGVGDTDLAIARNYNSLAAFGSGAGTTRFTEEGGKLKSTVVAGPPQYFGRAWTFPYAVRLLVVDNLLLKGAQVFYPDGRVVSFRRDGTNFTPLTPFSFDVLTQTASGYELRNKRTLEVEVFDDDGRLVGRKDRNGNQVRLTYAGERLTRVENDSGRWLTFEYHDDGTISAITAPEGKRIVYAYAGGNLSSVTDARGNPTGYTYSDKNQLTQVTTPKGHPALRLSYDDQHRAAEQIIGEKERYAFGYSSDGRQTTLTDSYGKVTTHVYDDKGRLVENRDALNFSEFYGYNDQFNRDYFKDRLGREFRYTFDDRGNKLTEAGPLGWRRAWEYNALDQATRFEDAEGRAITYTYDSRGNLTKVVNKAGVSSTIAYDSRGLPTEVRDFNGNVTANTYDPNTGDLVKTRNGAGDEVASAYDGLGRLRTLTNGRGFVTTYTYDGNDNLVQVDGPLGFQLRYSYDKNNNRETATDANGGVTTFVYDASENLVEERNPLQFATRYTYDDLRNLTQVEDAEGRVWTFEYDAVYNRVAEHGPEDTHTLSTYNAVRQVTDVTHCNSPLVDDDCAVKQVRHFVYDDLDRVTADIANYVPGAQPSADTNVTTTFTYDRVGNILTRTDANGRTTRFTYDKLDQLIREEDAAQQVTTYVYDGMGNLTKVVNPRGLATEYRYDGANRLAVTTDALQQATRYAYDRNGNLATQTDPLGIVTRYTYDDLDRLEALTLNERPGEPTTSARNVTTRFAYDLHGNLRFVYDPRGSYVTEHRYDAAHRRVRTVDAEGGETVYAYDRVNNLTGVTDANGHTTTTAYDGLNRRTRVTNPEGHSVRFTYDRLGNLLTLTDARGNASSHRYDGLNRVVHYTDADGGIWRYAYDPVGVLLAETDANGHTERFTYDVVYRKLSRTDAEGNITSWTYDANGNPLTRTDGNGHVTTSTYDALDRPATRTNPEGETTAYAYNWQGNQTAMTEADGVVTAYAYDPLYRLSSVTQNSRPGEPATVEVNVTTRYAYDAAGNLVEIRDANDNPTTFTFDGLNRLTQEVDALGNTWDYAYDKTVNRVERIDALRTRTTYAYYADDQLKRISYQGGTFVAYTYDENNNVLTVANGLGTITRSYDKLNRLTQEQDAFGRDTAFTYDAVGNRQTVTYPDGRAVTSRYYDNDWLKSTTDPENRTTSYSRDGVGNITRQDNPNGTVVTQTFDKADRLLTLENRQVGGANTINSRFVYTYDKVGQRKTMEATYAWRQPGVETSTYTYDPLRRLVRDEDSQGRWTAYTFDRVGNRLTLTTNDDSLTNRPFDAKTLTYSYNAINQLLTVVGDTRPGSPGLKRTDNVAQALHAFRHEVAAQQNKGIGGVAAAKLLAQTDELLGSLYGNPTPRQSAVADGVAALRVQVEAYQAQGVFRNQGIATSLLAKLKLTDNANRGTSGELQTVTYTYDANGNRITKEFPGPQGPRVQGTDYRYDPENRLVQAQDYQGNQQGGRVDRAVTTLDHDGEGRRLLKVYDPKDGGGGAKRVEYAYDGVLPIAEYNIWNPQYENLYRGDMGRILELHHFPSGSAGQAYWYHYDGLGSVAGLTKQSGQSSHNYRYEPYGQIELPNGNFTDPHNHYTFTGQEWDEHTGLYEFFARAYDPDTGTWLTQDTYRGQFVEPRSLHRYQYVYNSPVNYYDPYGHWPSFVDNAVKSVTSTVSNAVSTVTSAAEKAGQWVEDHQDVIVKGALTVAAVAGTAALCAATAGVGCVVGAAVIGGALSYSNQVVDNAWKAGGGESFSFSKDTFTNIDWRQVATDALISGLGAGIGQLSAKAGGALLSGCKNAACIMAIKTALGAGEGALMQIASNALSGDPCVGLFDNVGSAALWGGTISGVTSLGSLKSNSITSRPSGGTGADYDRINGHGIYALKDSDGVVRYIGRGDAPSRIDNHALDEVKGELDSVIIANNNLSYAEARGLEQMLIDNFGGINGGQLLNKVNGISVTNSNGGTYMKSAQPLFEDALSILSGGR